MVDGFQFFVEVPHGCALAVVFVGAQLDLFLIVPQFGIAADVCLLDETERPDDGQGHLLHLQPGRHGAEASLKEQVHQCCVEQVVLMVPEGDFVAPQRLRQVEKLLAPMPRTEKADGLLSGGEGGGPRRCLGVRKAGG